MKVFLLMTLVAIVTIGQAEFQCEDGDSVPDSYECDQYCDCQMCDDEADCEDGLGVSRFEIGDIEAKLHVKKEGGAIGIRTIDLPFYAYHLVAYPFYWVYYCVTEGYCDF